MSYYKMFDPTQSEPNILSPANRKTVDWTRRSTGDYSNTVSASGGSSATAVTSGVRNLQMLTGASTTGAIAALEGVGTTVLASTIEITLEASVLIGTLSDATNEYYLEIGYTQAATAAGATTAGISLFYDRAANGANWQAGCADGGTPSVTDTGVAVVASSFVSLKIIISGTTSAKFYIGGSLVATISTALPPTAVHQRVQIKKSAGATSRNIRLGNLSTTERLI